MNALTTYSETKEITQEQWNKLVQHVQYDRLKEEVKKQIQQEEFNTHEAIERFLNITRSERTREIYAHILHKLTESVDHILSVTAETADDIVDNLKQTYAPSTVRLYIACLSGFYSSLVRWGHINSNPFSGCSLPKKERSKDLVVPDEAQVRAVLNYYENIFKTPAHTSTEKRIKRMAEKMIVAVTLMSELGIRVGAIEGLQIKGNRYRVTSKGKTIKGEFTIDESFFQKYGFDLSKEFPFAEIKKPAVQRNLDIVGKELGFPVHAHGFRHYFAVRVYEKTKDVYEVSKLLNHSSVAVTENYLESIDINLDMW